MKIFTELGDRVEVKSLIENKTTTIQDRDSYYSYSLGSQQLSYSIHIPYQNGWYSARMFPL